MNLQSLDRWKASGLHLAISALIALTVVMLVLALWYPAPYFSTMGGETLLRLLIGVDVVLGPLITLIIFDTRKPELKQDLVMIVIVQIVALAYGSYVMFEARPVYNVFNGDRFRAVSANSIDAESRARAAPEYRSLPLSGPLIIGARPPADPQEVVRISLGALTGGADVEHLPHLFVPYRDVAADVARIARPLVELSRRGPEEAGLVSAFVAAHGGGTRSLGYVPVVARSRDFVAIVDRADGQVIGFLSIKP